MARLTVADLMTREVVYLPAETTLDEAAQAMRDGRIGDVLVTRGPTLSGLVTDRDIVIRAIAEGRSPKDATLGDIESRELLMIEELAGVAEALQVMHDRNVRRLLVCDADRHIAGIISLSDVAMHPRTSALLADDSGPTAMAVPAARVADPA
ncbi:CBS domain-containing protein [Spirilliplanes yamanashiensis]|uniref:CBS domain-containing protein n=1 Tax=Spirilliplanes yamanashiensis TaxID=42233 RepID=A0A8J3Y7B3_9ACTN|nr:CBS domain-containing protein [Spirilliplanes yamanashiensis]MDP9814980.1 CBS domain-containing protein [Spirilliplanes yamanashiensis]GIJ02635.1 CBS domain-containing protein [Spirilliplanes yamanashiensis]